MVLFFILVTIVAGDVALDLPGDEFKVTGSPVRQSTQTPWLKTIDGRIWKAEGDIKELQARMDRYEKHMLSSLPCLKDPCDPKLNEHISPDCKTK